MTVKELKHILKSMEENATVHFMDTSERSVMRLTCTVHNNDQVLLISGVPSIDDVNYAMSELKYRKQRNGIRSVK